MLAWREGVEQYEVQGLGGFGLGGIPTGSKVVPFCGLYFGSYKATPKRNYFGAYGIVYRIRDWGSTCSELLTSLASGS